MERQLSLLEPQPSWRLDEQTREVGRRGIEAARDVLRAARRPASADPRADQGDDARRSAA